VLGFDLVTADGEIARASTVEEPELFHCGRVSLGALGIVTRCTLQCVPAFRLRMEERRCSVDELVRGFAGVVASNEYVEASWWPYADVCTLRCSNRTREPVQRATRLETWRDEVLVGNYFAGVLTEVGRVRPSLVPRILRSASARAGRAHKVDWSPNVFAARRLVPFVTMEYAIARASLGPALLAVRELIGRERLTVDMPVVVRVAAADDVPLSTAFDRDSAYVAARVSAGRAHGAYFDGVEAIMEGLGGRPHWGAVHGQTAATLAPRYPEWERFRALRASLDPEGRFANAYTARVLGPPS
jgi:L-gulonolactone oxidase